MRGQKSIVNTLANLMEQTVAIICGFILPRLILMFFGSKYNGLTTSISQFLSCAVLLRSGIGGATRVALYKPLAENDRDEINSIIKATDIFMKKIGMILALSITAFAIIYPIFVKNEFGWFFTFSLFMIIGAGTFAENFFGITYLILLQADQKLWVTSFLKTICYIANTLVLVLLILMGGSIHAVKLASTVIYVLNPIILGIYVRRKYNLDLNVEPNNKAIAQRWDVFWHQVATFVMQNTDVMVLTVFSNMLEVSVYSVYNLIVNGLKNIMSAFSSGLEAAFGNMIAKNEYSILKENIHVVELIIFSISTVIYTVALLLILQFVRIYTYGVTDIDYIRPEFAYVLLIAQFFNCIRIPYQLVVQAAGHYKQTRNGAIVEAVINLAISVVMVIKWGLVGVAIGTLVATIFRTVQYSIYMSKNIAKRSAFETFFRIAVSFGEMLVIVYITSKTNVNLSDNYLQLINNAVIATAISIAVVFIGNIIFFKKDQKNLIIKLKSILRKG